MTAPDTPTAARTLLKQLEGWSVAGPTYASGPCTFTAYGEPRGDGTRPRLAVTEVVDSVMVRACHVDGRALVALWIHRHGNLTPKGAKRWALDMAWRARHPSEHVPRRITETQLKAYVAAPDHAAALAAVASNDEQMGEVA